MASSYSRKSNSSASNGKPTPRRAANSSSRSRTSSFGASSHPTGRPHQARPSQPMAGRPRPSVRSGASRSAGSRPAGSRPSANSPARAYGYVSPEHKPAVGSLQPQPSGCFESPVLAPASPGVGAAYGEPCTPRKRIYSPHDADVGLRSAAAPRFRPARAASRGLAAAYADGSRRSQRDDGL